MSTKELNIFPDFGTALEEALIREGKSSAWLSRVTGKDKGQISKYINGNITPRGITQRQLTAPLSVDILKLSEGEWEIVSTKSEDINRIEDFSFQYTTGTFEQEKKKLENLFTKIHNVETLFNEFEQNMELTNEQKQMQIEMIREKLFSILKDGLES